MNTIHISQHIQVWDRLTTWQKLFLILQEREDVRDSYDLITNEYYRRYPDSNIKKQSLERIARFIQHNLWFFPPKQRTIRRRKAIQQEIIRNSKKKSFLQKIKNFLTF